MTSYTFKQALSRWDGLASAERFLAVHGFSVHSKVQNLIASACPSDARQLFEYWNEVSKEYMWNAGDAVPLAREIRSAPYYRSNELDELASSIGGSLRSVRSLHPCERKFYERLTDVTYLARLGLEVEKWKRDEVASFGFSPKDESKSSMKNFFSMTATEFGWKKASGGWWGRRVGKSLYFECRLDTGIKRGWGTFVPTIFKVEHDSGEVFLPIDLEHLVVPHFWFYRNCKNSMEAQLGIRAFICLVSGIASNIDSDAEG